jgi:uncharacterized protein (TIGR02246 family)
MTAALPEDLHRLLERALNAGDLDAIAELYEQEACMVPAPGGVPVQGKGGVRQVFSGFVAMQARGQIRTLFVVASGDLALLASAWRIRGSAADGSPVEMAGQGSEIARRQADGSWLFVIDQPFAGGG